MQLSGQKVFSPFPKVSEDTAKWIFVRERSFTVIIDDEEIWLVNSVCDLAYDGTEKKEGNVKREYNIFFKIIFTATGYAE